MRGKEDLDKLKLIIRGLLKDNPQGLSIEELSSNTGIYRTGIRKALAELKGEGKINIREIGQVKLSYWKEQPKEVREMNGDGL